jgi:hypothetical protein
MFCWFDENYTTTFDDNDIIELKDVYSIYKISDKYINSSKEEKRNFSYKNFIKGLENNAFLKNYLQKSSSGAYIMKNMKKIDDDTHNNDDIDDIMNEEDKYINTEEEIKIEKEKEKQLVKKISKKNKNKDIDFLDDGIMVDF